MIGKLKYLYAGALALSAAAFVACDDSEEELNGWTDTSYVYVRGETLGNELGERAYIVAQREGLVDPTPMTYSFQVCLNRAASADVTVEFDTEFSGGSVGDVLDNTVVLNPASVTIPAGELMSEPIEMTVNPEFLAVTDAVQEYDPTKIVVKLGELTTADASVRLSTKTDKITATCKKSVKSQVRFCPTAKNPLPAHLAGSCIRRISAAETVGAAVQAICVTGPKKRKIKVFSVKEQKNENR